MNLRVSGDAKEILRILTEKLGQQEHSEWMARVAGWKEQYPLEQKASQPDGVTPQEVLETLAPDRRRSHYHHRRGQHQMWAAQFYEFRRPRQFLTSGGLGTMGFGLGAAIGAQVAEPGRKVINITGTQLPHELQRAATA